MYEASTPPVRPRNTEWKLTGWHVLAILLAAFALILTANGALTYFALKSSPGKPLANAYAASQQYNGSIAAARAQDQLGWRADIVLESQGERRIFRLSLVDSAAAPVDQADVVARLEHPVDRNRDIELAVRPAAGGYELSANDVHAGSWTLIVEADRRGRTFRSANRLTLK